jgi:hypothetical protein
MLKEMKRHEMDQEPCGFNAGDPNVRRYVGNDPVNATDPSGLKLTIGNKVITSNIDSTLDPVEKMVRADAQLKTEIVAYLSMMDTLISSKVGDYKFATLDELNTFVRLRLLVIIAAKQVAAKQQDGSMIFSLTNSPVKFKSTDFTAVKVKIGTREIDAIQQAKGTASQGIDAIMGSTKANPFECDCATACALIFQSAYKMYLGGDYNKKTGTLILGGPYGMDKLLKLGDDSKQTDLLPGDLAVWQNPGAINLAWKVENSIYLGTTKGKDMFFAPGVGIMDYSTLRDKIHKEGGGPNSSKAFIHPEANSGKPIVP